MTTNNRQISILVFDNEKHAHWFLRKIFELIIPDLCFYEAVKPEEAARLAKEHKPDLIITEVFYGRNGRELNEQNFIGPALLKEMKETSPNSKIIVCTTVYDGIDGKYFTRDYKAEAYFRKPYNLVEVLEKSLQLLGISQTKQAG